MASNKRTLAGIRTLVVEDERYIASALERMLVRTGARVTVAPTVEAARKLLQADAKWDLVLLDQKLPDGDGLEVLDLMVAYAPRPALVAVSAHLQDPKRALRLQSASAILLPKPFDWNDLFSAVADALAAAERVTRESNRPALYEGESGEFVAQLSYESISVHLVTQTVTVNGERVDLQPAQFRILAQILARAGRSVPIGELVEGALRGAHSDGSANIRFQIHALRRRLGTAGKLIETSEGGYGLGLGTPSPPDNDNLG